MAQLKKQVVQEQCANGVMKERRRMDNFNPQNVDAIFRPPRLINFG